MLQSSITEKKITYSKLFEYIDEAASAFVQLGIKENDIVTILLPNIPENVIVVYALNKIGAIANLVDLRTKGKTLLSYFDEVRSEVVIVCDLFIENTLEVISKTQIKKMVIVSPYDSLAAPLRIFMKLSQRSYEKKQGIDIYSWKNFMSIGRKLNCGIVKETEIACILHTSGTTGMPKGVMLTNYCFNAMTVQYRYSGLEFSRQDSFFNQVPPFLAYNIIMSVHLPLILHMKIILLPDYQPHFFAQNIMKYKPNHVLAGPADWENFLETSNLSGKDFSFLKTMASGSDTMQPKIKRKVNDLLKSNKCKSIIIEGYGMTEVGSAACTNLPTHDVGGSVGIPLPGTVFSICDEEDKELQYNEIGEICIMGPTLMKGYYRKQNATSEIMRKHNDGEIWLHTGDLGYISETGNVFLQGRIKRIIVRYDGLKISPFVIEKVIMQHEKVSECCVVGMHDFRHEGNGQIPIAFIKINNGAIENGIKIDIMRMCQEQLSEKYLPYKIIVTDNIPLTANGKIDYRKLELNVSTYEE